MKLKQSLKTKLNILKIATTKKTRWMPPVTYNKYDDNQTGKYCLNALFEIQQLLHQNQREDNSWHAQKLTSNIFYRE